MEAINIDVENCFCLFVVVYTRIIAIELIINSHGLEIIQKNK